MKRFGVTLVALTALAIPLVGQQFGGSVAVAGDQIFIGEASNQTLPGIVYVFENENGTWTEADRLIVGDMVGPPDGFGRSMTFDGATLVVGSPSPAAPGVVYAFRRDASGGWTNVGQITANDGSDGDGFGAALALKEDVAVISSPGQNDATGAVYVFHRANDGRWSQHSKLLSASPASGQRFGSTIALHDGLLLVGSPDRRGTPGGVQVFRFDAAADTWNARGNLEAADLGERSGFGAALSFVGDRALVGAPGYGQRVGSVFVFRYDADSDGLVEETRLAPFDSRRNTSFGSSIAHDQNTVWIGAPGDGGTGAVHVFTRDDAGNWTSATKLASGTLEDRASFGSSGMVGGDLAIIGATGIDSRAGAAVVFERGASGEWMERNTVLNDARSYPAMTGGEVECAGDRIAGFECSQVNVMSFLPINEIGGGRGVRVNDIWGWTDPETGTEYAIIGRTDGTSFVEMSNPSNPVYLGNLPKTEGSRSSIWRDMKVYRDHAYIVADGANEHGVQVFDLRQLRSVRNPPVAFEPTYTYDGIHSAHNIVINEQTGFAYAVGTSGGGETCGGGLHMLNLDDPGRPTFAGCFADVTTGRRQTGYSHDAQCVEYHGPDTEHQGKEICLGSNETALSVADVTDKANPIALAAVSYPNVAYAHQGWLTEDHRYFYMNDEGDEPQGLVAGTRTLVWDVTDLDDPILVKEHIASTTSTDHNLYIRGNLMYQSNYDAGLRVLDVSDPENPVEIGFFDTTPYGGGGSWSNFPFFDSGLVIATGMGEGLFVLRATGRPVMVP